MTKETREQWEQDLIDGLVQAGKDNTELTGGDDDRKKAMENIAEPICEAIKNGAVKLHFVGSYTVAQLNSLQSKEKDGIYGVTDNGALTNPDGSTLQVTAGSSVMWDGSLWHKFLDIDLSDYYTKEQVDRIVANVFESVNAAISSERAERSAADSALGERIDAEATARANADAMLQGNIDAEANARESADDALDARLTTAEGDIDTLETAVDALYNSEVSGTADEIAVSSSTSGKVKTFVVSLASAIKTKINAAYNHISDTVKHITASERTNWNTAYTHSQTDGNPHGTTIEDISGLRSELIEIESDVEAVEAVIPSEASASNQLADKAFVNSSVATNTATFRGTSAAGLTEAQFLSWANGLTKTNNDYVFWNTTDANGNVVYKRYKYNGTSWIFEYALNNSSFTAGQWAAINSGITESDVQDIGYNTEARHSHSNKNLLDSYNQSNANIADAVSKKHSHTNKDVLDATTASFTTADETKLDGIETGANKTVVDSALSGTSKNPVQNKVVKGALDGKAEVYSFTQPGLYKCFVGITDITAHVSQTTPGSLEKFYQMIGQLSYCRADTGYDNVDVMFMSYHLNYQWNLSSAFCFEMYYTKHAGKVFPCIVKDARDSNNVRYYFGLRLSAAWASTFQFIGRLRQVDFNNLVWITGKMVIQSIFLMEFLYSILQK